MTNGLFAMPRGSKVFLSLSITSSLVEPSTEIPWVARKVRGCSPKKRIKRGFVWSIGIIW